MTRDASQAGGFTFVEVMVSVVLLVGILLIALSTSQLMTDSISTQAQSSEVTHVLHRLTDRIEKYARPGLRSTCKVRATAADVAAAVTAGVTPLPAVGDWITAPQLDARPNFQLYAADGVASMNGMVQTTPRSLEFALEAGEVSNGIDDDGDGLVDEGVLSLWHMGFKIILAKDLESCTFELDGEILLIKLRCARRDRSGTVLRAALQRSVWIRNS